MSDENKLDPFRRLLLADVLGLRQPEPDPALEARISEMLDIYRCGPDFTAASPADYDGYLDRLSAAMEEMLTTLLDEDYAGTTTAAVNSEAPRPERTPLAPLPADRTMRSQMLPPPSVTAHAHQPARMLMASKRLEGATSAVETPAEGVPVTTILPEGGRCDAWFQFKEGKVFLWLELPEGVAGVTAFTADGERFELETTITASLLLAVECLPEDIIGLEEKDGKRWITLC